MMYKKKIAIPISIVKIMIEKDVHHYLLKKIRKQKKKTGKDSDTNFYSENYDEEIPSLFAEKKKIH